MEGSRLAWVGACVKHPRGTAAGLFVSGHAVAAALAYTQSG